VLRDVPNRDATQNEPAHTGKFTSGVLSPVEAPVDAELLRKYISYSKSVQPELSNDALIRLKILSCERSASESEGSPSQSLRASWKV